MRKIFVTCPAVCLLSDRECILVVAVYQVPGGRLIPTNRKDKTIQHRSVNGKGWKYHETKFSESTKTKS
jgi:hypothetical protein